MKRVRSFLIALLLCFTGSAVAVAEDGNNQTVSNQDLLKKLGYSVNEFSVYSNSTDLMKYAQLGYQKDDVAKLSKDELNYLANLEGTLIGADVKYMEFDNNGSAIEISKEEYEQHKSDLITTQSICQVSPSGCQDSETTSNWMRLTTTISKISNTSPQEYLIKHDFNWLKTPSYRFKDAIGVAHHTSLTPIQNSELLTYDTDTYYSRNPIQGVGPWNFERVTSSSLWSANDKTGGIGFELQLREDTGMVNSTKQAIQRRKS